MDWFFDIRIDIVLFIGCFIFGLYVLIGKPAWLLRMYRNCLLYTSILRRGPVDIVHVLFRHAGPGIGRNTEHLADPFAGVV